MSSGLEEGSVKIEYLSPVDDKTMLNNRIIMLEQIAALHGQHLDMLIKANISLLEILERRLV